MSAVTLLAAPSDQVTTAIAVVVSGLAAGGGAIAARSVQKSARKADRENVRRVARVRATLRPDGSDDDTIVYGVGRVVSPDDSLVRSLERRSERRFELLTNHYADALRQSTTYFYLSLVVGIVGFVTILLGGIAVMAGVGDYAAIAAAAGLLIEAAAGLIFKQAHNAKLHAQENLTAIAASSEDADNRAMALVYSSRVQDPAMQDKLYSELAIQSVRAIGRSNQGEPPPPALPPPASLD
ncbi:MAG: hypothetical protein EOP28_00340 [Rhodococcus sp. (in: high G+C Gram-positive bacteria)]|nr:MAG: hypothetical protein EOP28_00340 [Rhodococcus sp. (in: high G+C Gram-positive bacteria)]